MRIREGVTTEKHEEIIRESDKVKGISIQVEGMFTLFNRERKMNVEYYAINYMTLIFLPMIFRFLVIYLLFKVIFFYLYIFFIFFVLIFKLELEYKFHCSN